MGGAPTLGEGGDLECLHTPAHLLTLYAVDKDPRSKRPAFDELLIAHIKMTTLSPPCYKFVGGCTWL